MSTDPLHSRLDAMFAVADRIRRLDDLDALIRTKSSPHIRHRIQGIGALRLWLENELVRLTPAAVDDAIGRLDRLYKEPLDD